MDEILNGKGMMEMSLPDRLLRWSKTMHDPCKGAAGK
jgi:hypothetical protein